MSCHRLTPTAGHAISKSLEPTSTRPPRRMSLPSVSSNLAVPRKSGGVDRLPIRLIHNIWHLRAHIIPTKYHLTRTYDTGLHVSLKWPLLIPWNKPQCRNLDSRRNLDSKRKACQPPLCSPTGMTPTAGCLLLSPPQGSYIRESYTWQRTTFNTPIEGTLTKLGWAHQWGWVWELALVILLEGTLLPLTPTRVIAFLCQLVN